MLIAVVGLGRMGRIHAFNAAHRVSRVRLAAVVDASEPVARRVGQELGVPWSTSHAGVLSDPGIRALVIATPPATHVNLLEDAAAAGRDVLCEKPLALDEADAKRAVEIVERTGIKLQMGFQMRFDPDLRAAASRIESDAFGRPYLFRTSLRDMRPPHGEYLVNTGGFVFDAAIHCFDLARWLVGEIVEVTTLGAALSDPRFEREADTDNLLATVRFESGAIGVIDNSRVAGYGFECSTELVGEHATVRVGSRRPTEIEWLTPGTTARDHGTEFFERFAAAYVDELDGFAVAVSEDCPPAVSCVDGLAATRLCVAATRSLELGTAVEVPGPVREVL